MRKGKPILQKIKGVGAERWTDLWIGAREVGTARVFTVKSSTLGSGLGGGNGKKSVKYGGDERSAREDAT